jgi:hypothetical protein
MFPEIVQIPAFSPGKYDIIFTSLGKSRKILGNVLTVFETANLLEIFSFLLEVLLRLELLKSNLKAGRLRLLTSAYCNMSCK